MMARQAPSARRARTVTLLGATGSVGRSTLSLIAENAAPLSGRGRDRLRNGRDRLAAIARVSGAKLAVIGDPSGYRTLKDALAGTGIEAAAGGDRGRGGGVAAGRVGHGRHRRRGRAATDPGRGTRGAPWWHSPTRNAWSAPATCSCARSLAHGALLLPVDSEHNAIWQVLSGSDARSVRRLILTASGGPFRTWSAAQMAKATPAQAIAHPKWSMGAKISVDSATMMNKGLEIIEAHHLFALPESAIDVLVHPQSIVHSLVAFKDGSLLAQLGEPDMRIPIACTLGWPARLDTTAPELDLCARSGLEFEPPDEVRFPALQLRGTPCGRVGRLLLYSTPPMRSAVAAFLDGRIGFLDIARTVERVLERAGTGPCDDLETVLAQDALARRLAAQYLPAAGDLAIA